MRRTSTHSATCVARPGTGSKWPPCSRGARSSRRWTAGGGFDMATPVGQSVSMIDADDRVRGAASYILNEELPGCLVGRILRSPYAHARVLKVDTSRAERIPGVVAVLSREDLIDNPLLYPYYGMVIRDQAIV